MEKLFWGMVGGCTIAFGILLAMYLNQSGAFDSAEEETTTAVIADAETQESTDTEESVAEGEYPADIRSLIENSQGNYATAMLVFEEDEARRESAAVQETKRPSGQTNVSSSTTTTTTNNGGTGKNDAVDTNRNDNHDYFLEQPSESAEEESYVEESSTADTPSSKTDSDFQYDLYRDHVVIKKYTGSAASLDIPDTIEGKPVTQIGDSAFSNSKSLVKVTMPDTVEKIGKNAFKGCALLVDIYLSDGLLEMGEGVFDSCEKLARISIPDGVTAIGKKAFNECTDCLLYTSPSPRD